MHTGFGPCVFLCHEAPRGGCFMEEGSVETVFERSDGQTMIGLPLREERSMLAP
jgi:hypothetical protein